MDLDTQQRVLDLASLPGQEPPIVVLGAPDPESVELTALTVTSGDPTFAGPLAGVQLGLRVYHILEDELERGADSASYEEHVALMKVVLDREGIVAAIQRTRGGPGSIDLET